MLEENIAPRRRRNRRSKEPIAVLQKRLRRLVIELRRSGIISRGMKLSCLTTPAEMTMPFRKSLPNGATDCAGSYPLPDNVSGGG